MAPQQVQIGNTSIRGTEDVINIMKTKLLLSDNNGNSKAQTYNLLLLFLFPVLSNILNDTADCLKNKVRTAFKEFINLLFSNKILNETKYYEIFTFDSNISNAYEKYINSPKIREINKSSIFNMHEIKYSDKENYCNLFVKLPLSVLESNDKVKYQKIFFLDIDGKNKYEIETKVECVVEKRRNGNSDNIRTKFYIRSKSKEILTKFLKTISKFYFNFLKEDNKRNQNESKNKRMLYYYILEPPPIESLMDKKNNKDNKEKNKDEFSKFKFRCFKLNNNKIFDYLFIKNREKILNTVTHFKNKTGLYERGCVPHKLGILLYGPPGTGKTSFIKALSNFLRRDIKNISLSLVKKNQDLLNLFINEKIYLSSNSVGFGDYAYSELKNNIIVLEDIDCMGSDEDNVLLKRNREKQNKLSTEFEYLSSNSDNECSSECDSESEKEVNTDSEKKKRKKKIKKLRKKKKKTNNYQYYNNPYFRNMLNMQNHDKLDLSGILNILDGIIDTPGRVVIMTTNHVEKLDPALIRPGRIDHILHFDYMRSNEAKEMIEKILETTLNKEQLLKLKKFNSRNITPAELEQLCIFNQDSVEDLFKDIDKLE